MNFYFVPFHSVKNDVVRFVENNKKDFMRTYGDIEPDYDYFEQVSLMGRLFVALVFDDEIKGISGYEIVENAVHNGLDAENITFFVKKELRGQYTKDFMEFANKNLFNLGVENINATVKTDAVARLLKMNGFEKQYETWSVING